MHLYVVSEVEDYATGAYYFGSNKYDYYFKSYDEAITFYNKYKTESDNYIYLEEIDYDNINNIQWTKDNVGYIL